MQTTTEILSVDGVVLNTLAWNVESLTGRLKTPPLRGDNARVPSRNGTLYTPSKYYDEGQIVLPMWVQGSDEDGEIPYDSTLRKMFFSNVDTLTKLFSLRGRLLDLRHTLPDESVRQVFCEVQDVIDFATEAVSPVGKFSVVLRVPSAFWQDVDAITQTEIIGSSGATIEYTDFSGATAPMEDLVYTITGPITNPKVYAYENGVRRDPELSFQYDGVIAGGQALEVDCSEWKLTGTGGLTVSYPAFKHKGSARFMVLTPEEIPMVDVTGSALSGASSLAISGRRKFLVG